jgi:hypothetical protein
VLGGVHGRARRLRAPQENLCRRRPSTHRQSSPPWPPKTTPAFHAQLLTIARDYKRWNRADDAPHLAPELCAAPKIKTFDPSPVRLSASTDTTSHGQKLYFLYSTDPFAYDAYTRQSPEAFAANPNPPYVGLTLVKESWTAHITDPPPLPVPGSLASLTKRDSQNRPFIDFTSHDGKLFTIDQQRELFVMLYLGPDAPNTDAGWIYGTVTPDASAVTSAGKVASCMGCHQTAPRGRLFGLPSK